MMTIRKTIAVVLIMTMTVSLASGCGKKDADAGSKATESSATKESGASEPAEEAGNEETAGGEEKEANIPGHYDLWTYAAGGEYTVEVPHDELGMTGFVFLEADHTGSMGQSVSGTESSNNDITWDDDGNITIFGQNLYTFEVVGDVLIVNMGEGAVKYYYVREGVDAATAYNDFKQGKGVKTAADNNGGAGAGDNNDVSVGQMPVPADCMFRLAAREDMGKRITGNDLKKGGYDEYWLQSGVGGEVDFNMGTRDLHDGSFFLDDTYGAITRYNTDTAEPLYPYSVAADGDVLFVKVKGDTLIFARDGADTDDALKKAGETPDLKIKSGEIPEGLTGYKPTPRDVKIPMTGGNIYFDPANGHIDYIEPGVTEIDYPRGFDGIGIFEMKWGLYDANKLRIFHCAPDMFPVYKDEDTGRFGQDIYATHAGFGCASFGHAMFCGFSADRPQAIDYLGNIEYFEYGPVFCNANLRDFMNLRDSLSTDIKDYKMISGKDSEIKKLTEAVIDTDRDGKRILERVGKFCRSDYVYDYETGRYDTKHTDQKLVDEKEAIRKSLNASGHGIYNEGRAYLMRDMCVAAGIPCVTLILGKTDVYGDNYKSYEDYYNRNYEGEPMKSRHADDYADDDIPEDTQEQIDAAKYAAPMSGVFNLAYVDGRWQLINGNGAVGVGGKDVGPNGTFTRYEILEADGKPIDHVDRQECYKEVYDMQQDCFAKMIAKGELPDWYTFDHVLDDSGTYYLYDGIDEKGNVTLPEDTLGKKDNWIKLDMDGTGEMNFNGLHSKVAWCSNAGNLTCCSADAKACASFSGWVAARETRDTTGCRWDGKSREHGISGRILFIKDGKYAEQNFQVMEPYGVSMQLLDTDNQEEDGYRYRFLKDQGTGTPGSYGKSPWKK
ncbi:MAG: hypothetical protein J5829_01975 [Lachnospiraceae bacterium]|nr:hypothetical protein [Lachnospiraceae bacterium]